MKSPIQKIILTAGRLGLSAGVLTLAFANAWAGPQKPHGKTSQAVAEVTTVSSIADGLPIFYNDWYCTIETELATLVIQEQFIGALRAADGHNLISLVLDDGFQFTATAIPTVVVSAADGTVLSGRITPPSIQHFGSTAGVWVQDKRTFDIQLLQPSDTSTGPYTITIDNLRITPLLKPDRRLPAGNYNLTLTGSGNAQPGGFLRYSDLANGSNVGARPQKQVLHITDVWSNLEADPDSPPDACPPLGSSLSSSLSINSQGVIQEMVLASYSPQDDADVGRQGAIFVYSYLPNTISFAPNTLWAFDANRNWHISNICETAIAYSSGPLYSSYNIELTKKAIDTTPLVGSQLYLGHGLGSSIKEACYHMMQTGRYAGPFVIKDHQQ